MGKGLSKYAAKITQPQTVAGVSLSPEGGELSDAEAAAITGDAYGASLLEKGMLAFFPAAGKEAKDAARRDPAEGAIPSEQAHG